MLLALLLAAVPATAVAASSVASAEFDDAAPTLGEVDFTAVAADPRDPKLLYAAAAGAVYRSEDGGRTWSLVLGRQGAAAASAAREATSELERERSQRAAELLEDAIERLREDTEEEVFERLVDELGEDEARQAAADEAEKEIERERERLEADARARAERELPGGPERRDAPPDVRPGPALGFVQVHDLRAGAPGELLASTDAGLFRSSDGGATIRRLAIGLGTERGVLAADQDPREPWRMFVATRTGLAVPAGALFVPASGELGSLPINDVDLSDIEPDRVAAATDSGLFVSGDGGRSFLEVPLLPIGGGQRVVAVAWDLGTPGRAFAAAEDGKLYASEDGGATFELLAPAGLRGRTRHLWAPPVSSGSDPLLYASTDQGVFLSTDGGDSFEELWAGLASKDVRATVTPAESPSEPMAATGRGLFRVGGPQKPLPAAVRAELEWLERVEPRPDEVVARAVAHLELPASRYVAMQSRARWSAAGPRLVAALRRNHDDDTDAGRHLGGPTDLRFLGDQLEWGVLATWDLQRAIFVTDEPAIDRHLRQVVRLRQAVSDRAVRIFMARRRLLAELLAAPPGELAPYAHRLLQVEEQTARLDALTGGWYSEELSRRARAAGAVREPTPDRP